MDTQLITIYFLTFVRDVAIAALGDCRSHAVAKTIMDHMSEDKVIPQQEVI
jgi:hypothetical protein